MPTHTIRNLNAVSQTLLIPLYFRAMESHRPDALVRDPKAVELVGRLDHDFSGIQRLKDEQVNYLLRMREFDRLAWTFLAEHPDGVIVDLGCGLDTRFERIDNGQLDWYGLDLPEVIERVRACRPDWLFSFYYRKMLKECKLDLVSVCTPNAFHMAPTIAALKAEGLDFICISSGGVTAETRNPTEPGYNVPIAARVKKEAGIATRTVGLILTPEQAEAIVAEGKADMVSIARGFLDDPHWGWHAAKALGADVARPPQYQRAGPKLWAPAAAKV